MTTYTFKVVVEPDEDRWRAYCPALEEQGAATCGYTREELLGRFFEVLEMIVAEFIEEGRPVPGSVAVSGEPLLRSLYDRYRMETATQYHGDANS